MNVIVTDVRYRMSLPVIRALGKAGVCVTCTDLTSTPTNKSLGFFSKYTNIRAHLPEPSDTENFLTALKFLSCGEHPILMPVGMDTLLTLCANREEVRKDFNIALPSIDSITTANDKYELMRVAVSENIPCPATTTLREGEEISDMCSRVRYPAVIKYRAGELLKLDPKDRYCIVNTPEELTEAYEKMHSLQEFPLVQEYVSGDGFGVSIVMDKEHNPYEIFCHRRLREYPTSGGPSCLCESAWDDDCVKHAVKLLRALNWEGVAMVEFKGTPEAGFKLMEINPRFWGSLALAPISGCNIPLALAKVASGELSDRTELAPTYKVGQKMRFFLQDALAYTSYVKQANNKLKFTLKYILSLLDPRIKDGVFSFSDPCPGFKYLLSAFKKTDKIIR